MTAARRRAQTAAMTHDQLKKTLENAFARIKRMHTFANDVARFTKGNGYAAVYVNPTILDAGCFEEYDGELGLAAFVKWLASEHQISLKKYSITNGGPQGSNVYEFQLSGTADDMPKSINFAMGKGPGQGHFYAQGNLKQLTKFLDMMYLFLSTGADAFSWTCVGENMRESVS